MYFYMMCNNCKYEWNYKGKAEYYTSCPKCRWNVKIKGAAAVEEARIKWK